MGPFPTLLGIFSQGLAIPPDLRTAMDNDPALALAIEGGIELGSAPHPNWSALVALVLQLLPTILPLLKA